MRLAVISDIHANITALEAVLADLRHAAPDLVVVGGDLVGSGSSPAEVIDVIRQRRWPAIQGNTDEMLWNAAQLETFFATPALGRWRPFVDRAIAATLPAIGPERLQWLRSLPSRWSSDTVAVVHASPSDAWRAPGATASNDELLNTYRSLNASVAVYGHIHIPFVRPTSLVVANAGSVGMPYDEDNRAAYILIDGTEVNIRRVEYDIERELRLLKERCCPDAEWIAAILRAGAPVAPPAAST